MTTIRGQVKLAAEVEDLFGPMVAEPRFHDAVRRNIPRRSALLARDSLGPPAGASCLSSAPSHLQGTFGSSGRAVPLESVGCQLPKQLSAFDAWCPACGGPLRALGLAGALLSEEAPACVVEGEGRQAPRTGGDRAVRCPPVTLRGIWGGLTEVEPVAFAVVRS